MNALSKMMKAAAVLLVTAATVGAAGAQQQVAVEQQPPVISTMEAVIVDTDDDGNEVFRPAETVDPGEIIEYRIAHLNQSSQALSGFTIAGPIPNGTQYVAESASVEDGTLFEVKLPNEDWQSEPAYKTIINEAGEEERVIADPSEYVTIRWSLLEALPDQSTAESTYRVRVNTN